MSWFSKPRDLVLKTYLSRKAKRYGEIIDLQIDDSRKKIQLSILPKGEKEVIEIVSDYKLKRANDNLSMTFIKVKTSRAWLTLLVNDFLPYSIEGLPKLAAPFL